MHYACKQANYMWNLKETFVVCVCLFFLNTQLERWGERARSEGAEFKWVNRDDIIKYGKIIVCSFFFSA